MAAGRTQQRVSSSAVALVLLLVVLAAAQAGAARICNVDTSAVNACASYCKNGSHDRSPSQSCCSAVRGLDIRCACGLKGYAVLSGYSANRAMELPSKCGFGPSNPCG